MQVSENMLNLITEHIHHLLTQLGFKKCFPTPTLSRFKYYKTFVQFRC